MNPNREVPASASTRGTRGWLFAAGLLAASVAIFGFAQSSNQPPETGFDAAMLDGMTELPGGIGPLPPVASPADNPMTAEKVELGAMLFFDKRLSLDRTMSCASCHDPEKGFADGRPRGRGFKGKELNRHSPSVLNTAFNGPQFWDGRASGLEEQAKGPIMASAEMNMLNEKNLVKRLKGVAEYRRRFKQVFGTAPTLDAAARAIAAFERTIVSGESRFDRYARGDKSALTAAEKRGAVLFVGQANCVACHNGPNFTDNKFHALAVPQVGPLADDPGRYAVTKNPEDRGAFKTPTLRGIEHSAPYMHDGAFSTIEQVVEFYNAGGGTTSPRSKLIFPLQLTAQQKSDLVAFMRTLTGPLPDLGPVTMVRAH